MTTSAFWRWLAVIAVVAMGLRIGLALVNNSANDDHFPVIQVILEEGRLPTLHDGWEGFQPKLFHVTAAAVLRVLPSESTRVRICAVQMLNVFAGALTLFIVFRFLRRSDCSGQCMLMVFALVALNPKLIGINAQATNDSFVILFSTLGLDVSFSCLHWSRARFASSAFFAPVSRCCDAHEEVEGKPLTTSSLSLGHWDGSRSLSCTQ